MKSASPWVLDPRIEQDSIPLGELSLCCVRLAKDANYPWLILVPRRAGLVELTDLSLEDRTQLLAEIDATARALKAVTACDKLNIASLGNVVAQLHVHVIARRRNDPAWPRPVWGTVPAALYEPGARDRLGAALREKLAPA